MTGGVVIVPVLVAFVGVFLVGALSSLVQRTPESYDAGLTAAVYLDGVDRNAVRWIAVPDVDLDDGGGPEASRIASGALDAALTRVWSNPNWTLYEVAEYRPIVDPSARLMAQRADEIVVVTPVAATFTIRYAFAEGLTVRPDGCVSEDPDGWTRVTVARGGEYTLRVDPASLVGDGDVCAG